MKSLFSAMVITMSGGVIAGTSAAPVDVIYTNIPGHASAEIPGLEGVSFRSPLVPFLTLGSSPDGSRWIFKAFADSPGETNDVIMVGSGLVGAAVAREGDASPEDGRDYGFMDSDCGINDAGQYVFGNRLEDGSTADDEVLVRFDGTTFDFAVREGEPALGLVDPPGTAGDELFGNSLNSAAITADGTVTFRADLIQNVDSDYRSALYTGSTPRLQEGTSADTLLGGLVYDGFTALAGNTFTTDASGVGWIVEADVVDGVANVEAVVADGQVQFMDGDQLKGMDAPVDGIFAVTMAGNGDWYARGDTAVDTRFLVRNGIVVLTGGDPVAGDPAEAYTNFLGVRGRADGDFVLMATTDSRFGPSAVITLNNDAVLVRTGDPVDLDGDGVENDDVFVDVFAANDVALSGDRVYFFASLRDGRGTDLGDAFLSAERPANSPPGDLDGDGFVNASDLAILLAAWGPCGECPEDLDGDGTVGAADLAILLANWG